MEYEYEYRYRYRVSWASHEDAAHTHTYPTYALTIYRGFPTRCIGVNMITMLTSYFAMGRAWAG